MADVVLEPGDGAGDGREDVVDAWTYRRVWRTYSPMVMIQERQ